VELAGIVVDRLAVLELAERLSQGGHDDTAMLLRVADAIQVGRLGLTVEDREVIIGTLDDAPPGLQELRGVLLDEHVARVGGEMA
jgi:hypothetical protein